MRFSIINQQPTLKSKTEKKTHDYGNPHRSISKVSRNFCPSLPPASPGADFPWMRREGTACSGANSASFHEKGWNVSMKSAWLLLVLSWKGKIICKQSMLDLITRQFSLRYMVTWFRIAILCDGSYSSHKCLELARKVSAMYCPKLASIPCVDPHPLSQ